MWVRFPDVSAAATAARTGRLRLGPKAVGLGDPAGAVWVDPTGDGGKPPRGGSARLLPGLLETLPLEPNPTPPAEAPGLMRFAEAGPFVAAVSALRRLGTPPPLWVATRSGFWVRSAVAPAVVLMAPGAEGYTEAKPGVWVRFDWRCPLVQLAVPPDGRWFLVAPDGWRVIHPPTFGPADARHPFPVADLPTCEPGILADRLGVRLTLVARTDPERPTLWVFPDDPVGRLLDLVRRTDGRLLEDLEFAVTDGPHPRALLRPYPGRAGPATLPTDALPFAPVARLPNAYAPAGAVLRPPLRRDALRDLLCRPGAVSWLMPAPGGFVVESIPADAFRPLGEWVEYAAPARAERPRPAPLRTPFEPDHFLEIAAARNPAKTKKAPRVREDDAGEVVLPPTDLVVRQGVAPKMEVEDLPPLALPDEPLPPSDARVALAQGVADYLALPGPADAPARVALWPRLAYLAGSAQEADDAGIAWCNAQWFLEDSPEGVRRWAEAEFGRPADAITADDLDAPLTVPAPMLPDVRKVAAALCWKAAGGPRVRPGWLQAAREFLETHEGRLPTRAAWLGWLAVARLSGGDVLALTRARDRLLADLLEFGVRRDRDLPAFLRPGGLGPALGPRVDVALFGRLMDAALAWCGPDRAAYYPAAFVRLTFAHALARFGARTEARRLMAEAPAQPMHVDPWAEWLWRAYRERVRQALEGERAGPLPASFRQDLLKLTDAERATAERVLQVSRILEPFDRVDPFRNQRSPDGLAALPGLLFTRRKAEARGAELVATEVARLLKESSTPAGTLRILGAAVPLAPRVGDAFAADLLAALDAALGRLDKEPRRVLDVWEAVQHVELLRSAVLVAAHFGRENRIPALLGRLETVLEPYTGELAARVLGALDGSQFRFLVRVGLKDPARALLDRFARAVLRTRNVPGLLAQPGLNRGVFLPALLRLAAGWFDFDTPAPARDVLAAVREELLRGGMSPDPLAALAADYAGVLGHAPLEHAAAGYRELFGSLPELKSYDGVRELVRRLRVVEAVVRATASDDFSSDEHLKGRLDEEEFLTRLRIHKDVRAAVG